VNPLTMAVTDGITIAKRNTLRIRRAPDMLGAVIIQPILMVLLFAYIFGEMFELPGISYREYMLPGIFAMTVVFGTLVTGYGLVEDLQKGIIDRFRSLPMSPSALMTGRTTSDLLLVMVSMAVMAGVGLLVGWRVHTSPPEVLLGFVVLLLFAFALSWVMSALALVIRTPEVFNNTTSALIFPVVFLSNTFVDSARLPGPLRVVAEWNPVSAVTQAARELFGNTSAAMPVPDAWPLQHPVLASLLWTALILVVFVPLATRLYKRAVSR
jgi:ABC-2 type transport system permease protein